MAFERTNGTWKHSVGLLKCLKGTHNVLIQFKSDKSYCKERVKKIIMDIPLMSGPHPHPPIKGKISEKLSAFHEMNSV